MKFTILTALTAAWFGMVADVAGKTLVEEFSGDRSAGTAEFEVRAPWIVDWRVASAYRTGTTIEVFLVEAGTGVNAGMLLTTTGTGNGVKLFDEGGRYFLRVNSNLVDWTLRVEELSEEEASRYTPKDAPQ